MSNFSLIDERSSSYLYLTVLNKVQNVLLIGQFTSGELNSYRKQFEDFYCCNYCPDKGLFNNNKRNQNKIPPIEKTMTIPWDLIVISLTKKNKKKFVVSEIFKKLLEYSKTIFVFKCYGVKFSNINTKLIADNHSKFRISVYLPLPSLAYFKILIPYNSPRSAAACIELYNPVTFYQSIRSLLLKFLLRTRLIQFAIKDQLIVYHPLSLENSSVEQLLKSAGVSSFEGLSLHNASIGPGTKAIIAPVSHDGDILGYIKITNNDKRKHFLRNERKTLRYLHSLKLEHVQINNPIQNFSQGDYEAMYFKKPSGKLKRSGLKLTNKHILFLAELFNKTRCISVFEEALPIKIIFNRINKYFQKSDRITILLNDGLQKLSQCFYNELHLALAHRDFVAWNIQYRDNELYVYDWEWAELSLPFYDLFYFIVHGQYHLRKRPLSLIIEKMEKNDLFQNYFKNYAILTSTDISKINFYLLFFLIDRVTFDIEQKGFLEIDEEYIKMITYYNNKL